MARFKNGWVKIHRRAILGDIGSNYIRSGLFQTLICIANISRSTVSWGGKPTTLERGEIVTSLKELADLGEVDRKTVMRHLNYLSLRGTISIEKSYGGLKIKIPNFDKYQSFDAEGSKMSPSLVDDLVDHHVPNEGTHIEELKNIRIKERKNIKSKFDFASILSSYPTKQAGAGAEARFAKQIKTEKDYSDLKTALEKYTAYLKIEDWRRPKQTLATFLGTEQSGFFWKDWVDFDLEQLKAKTKNYQNESGTDHDLEISKLWDEGA